MLWRYKQAGGSIPPITPKTVRFVPVCAMEDIGTKDDWAAAQRVFILSGVPESMGVPPSTLEPPHPDETNRRIVADFGMESRHTLSMGSEPLKLQEKLAAEYRSEERRVGKECRSR